MPKIKTHSGTKKRFKITKTGKIVRRHAGGGHFLQKKGASRKRRLAGVEVLNPTATKSVRRNLGI